MFIFINLVQILQQLINQNAKIELSMNLRETTIVTSSSKFDTMYEEIDRIEGWPILGDDIRWLSSKVMNDKNMLKRKGRSLLCVSYVA